MSVATCTTSGSLQTAIATDGYAFVQGDAMRGMLAPFGPLPDWRAFADSWNALEFDGYRADGGRYRRRRYGAYAAARDGAIPRKPHQPHFQAIDYNPLNGGVPRWFEPIDPEAGGGPSMGAILSFCRSLFDSLAPGTSARQIEVHQFLIEPPPPEQGPPPPARLDHDGAD